MHCNTMVGPHVRSAKDRHPQIHHHSLHASTSHTWSTQSLVVSLSLASHKRCKDTYRPDLDLVQHPPHRVEARNKLGMPRNAHDGMVAGVNFSSIELLLLGRNLLGANNRFLLPGSASDSQQEAWAIPQTTKQNHKPQSKRLRLNIFIAVLRWTLFPMAI